MRIRFLAAALAAGMAGASAADDRAEFNRRAAQRDVAAFSELDDNRDRRVTREEAAADIDFVSRFQDMDINRDGAVFREELDRYLRRNYGVEAPP